MGERRDWATSGLNLYLVGHTGRRRFSSPRWTRTTNLLINSQPLCQLSYRGRRHCYYTVSWYFRQITLLDTWPYPVVQSSP